jgi:hypothetical protein
MGWKKKINCHFSNRSLSLQLLNLNLTESCAIIVLDFNGRERRVQGAFHCFMVM